MLQNLEINTFEIDARLKQLENCEEHSYTILHCTYYSDGMYVNGGWVTIWESTFLENVVTKDKLRLVVDFFQPVLEKSHPPDSSMP